MYHHGGTHGLGPKCQNGAPPWLPTTHLVYLNAAASAQEGQNAPHVHPPNPPASPGLAGFPSPVISLRPGHRHSGAEQRHKLRVVIITPHSDYNIVRAGLEGVPFVEYMADLSQNVTAPTGHARPRLISQQKKGTEGKRERRKWVFCPVHPLPSHQPRDYQPTYQRLFPSMQHLVSKEVCLPFPLPCPGGPSTTSRGPVSCVAPARRGRERAVVSPSESPTPDEASANRWTSSHGRQLESAQLEAGAA